MQRFFRRQSESREARLFGWRLKRLPGSSHYFLLEKLAKGPLSGYNGGTFSKFSARLNSGYSTASEDNLGYL